MTPENEHDSVPGSGTEGATTNASPNGGNGAGIETASGVGAGARDASSGASTEGVFGEKHDPADTAAGRDGAASDALVRDPSSAGVVDHDAGEVPEIIDIDAVLGERETAAHQAAATGEGTAEDKTGGDTDEAREPTLMEQLAASEALAADHWDRLMRLQAEMENQRKRAQRDVTNARKFALDGIAGDLLPVRDSLELGLQAASSDGASLESLREGSELTLKMLSQVLEKHAIAEINPEGEKFDPEFHQAMSAQSVDGVAPNTVISVMQKGYTLNERLIRPALVLVSK